MDVEAAPTHEVVLVYGCGCRDVWLAYKAYPDAVTTICEPCLPDICHTCLREGVCETRRTMLAYTPVAFSEIEPVRRSRPRRLKLRG